MPETTKLASMLRYFRVTSYITGVFLLVISVLFALRLSISSDLWVGGPHGLISLAEFSTDPSTGAKTGLPSQGFSLTSFALIVHGWLYVAYLYGNFQLWINLRWGLTRFFVIPLGGVVPFLSFFTERYFHKFAQTWQVPSVGTKGGSK